MKVSNKFIADHPGGKDARKDCQCQVKGLEMNYFVAVFGGIDIVPGDDLLELLKN